MPASAGLRGTAAAPHKLEVWFVWITVKFREGWATLLQCQLQQPSCFCQFGHPSAAEMFDLWACSLVWCRSRAAQHANFSHWCASQHA